MSIGRLHGFTDLSNNTLHMGNPTQGEPSKGVNCYETAEYTADLVTHNSGYTYLSFL